MRTTRGLAALLLVLVAACVAGCGEGDAGSSAECADLDVTISGTKADDKLRGTPGRDVIDGRGGDDTVDGLGGDDVLCGGVGADVLRGGDGDDQLFGGADAKVVADTEYYEWEGDRLEGGGGDDLLDGGLDPTAKNPVTRDQVSYASATAGVGVDLARGTASGEGEDRIVDVPDVIGSEHDDRLLGTDGPDRLSGGYGSDHLDGRSGDDDLDGTAGVPTIDGVGTETVANALIGGPGDDELHGNEGPDRIVGGPGADILQADGGTDHLLGGAGNDSFSDIVLPGEGQVLDGGPGRDSFAGVSLATTTDQDIEDGVGRIDLAAGLFTATAADASYRVPIPGFEDASSPLGRWVLVGTEGDNELMSGFDHAVVEIHAGAGNDLLAGSFGDDLLDGGPGRDVGLPYVGDDRLISIERTR